MKPISICRLCDKERPLVHHGGVAMCKTCYKWLVGEEWQDKPQEVEPLHEQARRLGG